MWKYKSILISSVLIMLLNIVFIGILVQSNYKDTSYYVFMLKQYTYGFFLSSILFKHLDDYQEVSLLLHRYTNVNTYLINRVNEALKKYGFIIIVMTVIQITIFILVDPMFEIQTLIYRNIVLYIFIIVVNIIYHLVSFKYKNQIKYILFVLWNIGYFINSSMTSSVLNTFNPFSLLLKMNLDVILKISIELIIVIFVAYKWYDIRKEKRKEWIS